LFLFLSCRKGKKGWSKSWTVLLNNFHSWATK
jgi:hypothetical protein